MDGNDKSEKKKKTKIKRKEDRIFHVIFLQIKLFNSFKGL